MTTGHAPNYCPPDVAWLELYLGRALGVGLWGKGVRGEVTLLTILPRNVSRIWIRYMYM